MKNFRPDILVRPLFLSALGLLLVNDFFLKYEYANLLTGKISDFAGLFIFPYFISSLRVKWAKLIYYLTAIFFLFWKLQFSQAMIDSFNSLGIGIYRVVDPTDLIALSVIPFSYICFLNQLKCETAINRLFISSVSLITLFAIVATTLPRQKVELNLPVHKVFELEISKAELFQLIHPARVFSDAMERNLQDSIFYFYFPIEDYTANIATVSTVHSLDSNRLQIRLDTISYVYVTGELFVGVPQKYIDHFESRTAGDYADYFQKYFIESIINRNTPYLYFDNKDLYQLHQDY